MFFTNPESKNLRFFFSRNFMFSFSQGLQIPEMSFSVMISRYLGTFDLNTKLLFAL